MPAAQIQISRQNLKMTPRAYRAKSKGYKPKKVKKLALNSQLLNVQILTDHVLVLILRLSYFITTVSKVLPSFCFPNATPDGVT